MCKAMDAPTQHFHIKVEDRTGACDLRCLIQLMYLNDGFPALHLEDITTDSLFVLHWVMGSYKPLL